MKHLLKIILPYIFAVVLFCGCAGNDSQNPPDTAVTEKTEENKEKNEEDPPKAAETDSVSEEAGSADSITFEAQDLQGNPVTSSLFSEAKLTMLNVWATYCGPCLNEMPGLGKLTREYDPADFQLIGIISDVSESADLDALALASDLIAQTGADYPHLLSNQSLYHALLSNVTAVPTTFFFNENGELVDIVVGAMDQTAWEAKINELLEK